MRAILCAALFSFLVVLAAVPAFSQTPVQTVTVTAERTSLRDKAAADGAIVVGVVKGDELEVLSTNGSWYHVRVKSSGKEGFVNSLVVSALTAQSASTAPISDGPAPVVPTPPPAKPATQPAGGQTVIQKKQKTPAPDKPVGYVLGGFGDGLGSAALNIGGGVTVRPFQNPAMGLQFDGIFGHSSDYSEIISGTNYSASTNALVFSGLFVYDFTDVNPSFTPFVGGGLSVEHVTSTESSTDTLTSRVYDSSSYGATSAGFTVTAGLQKPFGSDGHAFRVELRETIGGVGNFGLVSGLGAFGNSTMILAGISF